MDPEFIRALQLLLTAMLVATCCALPGSFLVLRRMALIGDAISHAVLPGITLGFAVTHSRHSIVMLIGAILAGLVTVWLVESLHRSRRVYEDAAIAIVFPALFALGVLVMDLFPHVDLDPDCVFQGDLPGVPDRLFKIGGTSLGPVGLYVVGGAALLNLALVLFFYKELKVTTFDPELAESLGFSPRRMHYLLMSAVSITTVAAFESVGAILVVSFLIVPPAAAYLLTDRLSGMLLCAVGIGWLSAGGGYLIAREEVLDCNPAGAMAAMAGLAFVIVWLLSPRHGLLGTLRRRRQLARRFAADLFLLHLRKRGSLQAGEAHAGKAVLNEVQRRGLIANQAGTLVLTPAGEQAVMELEEGYQV